jgi:hypothetical protein
VKPSRTARRVTPRKRNKNNKLVTYTHYLRVSTQKQGIDGYGIDAQRAAIANYTPAAEFIEVESGKRKDRPELLKALDFCKRNDSILVVAKLDYGNDSFAVLQ